MIREKKQMKRNKKISNISGILLIVLLVVFLFSIIFGVTSLMSNLDNIQSHPFQVLNAGSKLQNDIGNIRIRFEQLRQINTPEVVEEIRVLIEDDYQDAQEQLKIISEAYAGDKKDVEQLTSMLDEIKVAKEKFLTYAALANRSEEEIITYQKNHLDKLNQQFDRQLDEILEYARNRFNYFYESANNTRWQIILFSCVIFVIVLASMLIYKYLLKWQTIRLENQNQLFELLSRTIDNVFMINELEHPERNFISENAKRILGFMPDPQDISPQLLFKYMNKHDRQAVEELFQTEGETYWQTTFHYHHPAFASDKIFGMQTYRIKQDNKDQFITMLTDETQVIQNQRELEAAIIEAKQASQAKTEFLSRMSHEIRTPMNGITGMGLIAQQNLDNREKVADCLQKINLSSKHLLNLINDVLDMSKIESGKLEINKTDFDFKTFIETLNTMISQQAREKKIEFETILTGDIEEMLHGDSLRLNQILMNLLSNALKFTPKGGKIMLRINGKKISEDKIWMRFEVIDTGCGIAAENHQKIFEAFEQENKDVTRIYGGTGLGLSLCKRFTEMMNGKISVKSKLREGSIFIVELPFEQVKVQVEAPVHFDGLKALVADDDTNVLEHTKMLFNRLGVICDVTDNGYEAVAKVEQAQFAGIPYDICLIDWKMPYIDGMETAYRIKKVIAYDKPKLVLMSAYDTVEIQAESEKAGIEKIICKPLFESGLQLLLESIFKEPLPNQVKPVEVNRDFTGKRFLVVEDNELNREIATELLLQMNAIIETAEDGSEAVEKFSASSQNYYDLILMDIQMPKMNGYEATKAIRHLDREDAKSIPILAMTADAFLEDVEKSLQAGMNGHISKPIDLKDVYQKISEVLFK